MIDKNRFRRRAPTQHQPTRKFGEAIEQQTADWLCQRGFSLIKRNFRSRFGEIDIIGIDGEHLVFLEVRFRSNPRFGGAAVTVDAKKQRKLILAAQSYLSRRPRRQAMACRFDVVAVTPAEDGLSYQWHKAAFIQDDTNRNAF